MTDLTPVPTIDMDPIALLELQLIARARELAAAERERDQEFLLKLAGQVNSFQAQKQAEHRYGPAIREAQAQYEIALARLRRI